VAAFFGLDWKTVKELDFVAMERRLGPVDLDGLEVIGMDEFAIQKGHCYATVIVEPMRKRVLWVGRGRGRADVRPFFELLGPQRCKQLRAAVMDMNAGYEVEVKHHCPQAAIVFDLFHVVAKYGREVIDRVRVDRANELRANKPARQVVKGARWLLLKNRESLDEGQDIQLKELLQANRALFVVHLLRDMLKDLWRYRHPGYAQRAWDRWYSRARRSRIEPLKHFAAKLKPYLPGILAHCQFPLGTNRIEGINNKIKVIKRMAYGFRDDAYFFLKIRAAFPGVGRRTKKIPGHLAVPGRRGSVVSGHQSVSPRFDLAGGTGSPMSSLSARRPFAAGRSVAATWAALRVMASRSSRPPCGTCSMAMATASRWP
jgi:transposase